MEQDVFELAVVGGGIVGACVFNLAVLNGVKAVMLEAGDDVSLGATKANSGIVHSGYDPMPNTLMAKFNVRGNELYRPLCKRLKVELCECGTLLVSDKDGLPKLNELLLRGKENGVKGLSILNRQELLKIEPNLADNIEYGLYAKTGAIVSPYMLCIALAEEGVINGGVVRCNFEVCGIKKENDLYVLTNGKDSVKAKYVVNCAGAYCNEINSYLGEEQYPLSFVKGEYLLLDNSQKGYVKRPIFPLPSAISKGIIAVPTTHGNIMFGPTAVECERDDKSVSSESIKTIKERIIQSVKKPNFKKVIKLFAGVRVKSGKDFIISRGKNKNYYYTVGICSPGLTAAPAIAEYLFNLMKEDGIKTSKITPVERVPYINTNQLSKKELNNLIAKNADYGKIICKCEKITRGEIIDALSSPLKPTSVDAIKRRVRPTMGRCQGSFCLDKLVSEIAKFCNIEEEQVSLLGKNSEILIGDIKQGGKYDV